MPIHLEYSLTFADYFGAQRLHARRSWWLRLNWIAGQIVAPIWGVLFILFVLLTSGPGVSWVPIAIGCGCGLFLIAYPLYRRFKLKRCYMRTRIGSGKRAFEFGETQIRAQEEGSKSEIEWRLVQSFSENDKTFLLYLAPAKFIVIPKRVCADGQAESLRSLFRERIGKNDAAPAIN